MIRRNSRIIKRNNINMSFEFPTKNVGGYLPNPPENCERKDMWSMYHSGVWIDLSICHSCPIITACQTRKAYLKAVKENGIP